ncbi:MAG: CHAT domain-containing protein [Chloroflexi bacterium]|nr:CHAT domain-containing protein [Chloroflexota bacterium]
MNNPNEQLTDLEIRIFPSDESAAGYPIEITLGGQQEFPRGHLTTDILPWTLSGDLVADGQRLFETLFSDSKLRSAWDRASGQATQRRIRLWIDPNAAELHALPWELLHEADTMLAANADTPFSRYLPVSKTWGGVVEERPIRVLAAISNPTDLEDFYNLPALDVNVEQSILEKAFFLLDEDEIQMDFFPAPVTLERLEEKMQEGYHVLHYIGHGIFNKKRQRAALYMQDEEGDTQVVRDEEFINMLARQRTRVRPRLIFLAACQSATRSTTDAFRGLGPSLVQAGVPAVVAMQDFLAIKTAHKLSMAFYRRLAEHGLVDCALNEARSTLLTTRQSDAAVPVLFMRLKSGQLWESETEETDTYQEETGPKIPRPPEPMHPPEMSKFVGRETELAVLEETLTQSNLAIITGMPGMGQSALASALARRISDPEKIFWHTFDDGEGITEIIWKLGGFLFWNGQEELWRMLQSAQQSGGQPPPPSVMFDYLFQMVHGQGYTLCFDDFHFIDNDPLLGDFLERMHPTLRAGDMRLIITSHRRPSFAQSDEVYMLGGLSLENTIELFVQRGFLDPTVQDKTSKKEIYSTQTLSKMSSLTSVEFVTNLHARTGGNPRIITLATGTLKNTPNLVRFLLGLFANDNIERFLIKEIDDNLTEDERAVMGTVAVLKSPSTRDAIEAVLDKQNVRRTLNDLVQRHLLSVSQGESGREYSMNTIVRQFYNDSLGRRERRAMHRRAGEYYEIEEPDEQRAARHFELAGEHKRAAQLAKPDIWTLIDHKVKHSN